MQFPIYKKSLSILALFPLTYQDSFLIYSLQHLNHFLFNTILIYYITSIITNTIKILLQHNLISTFYSSLSQTIINLILTGNKNNKCRQHRNNNPCTDKIVLITKRASKGIKRRGYHF